mmetsp:Transcript_65283/g.183829  ORF Transcript_65283/g.183829 Transcript_65283/m.183829 type:complete len:222 (+) Transcript_65283:392-1057(+)
MTLSSVGRRRARRSRVVRKPFLALRCLEKASTNANTSSRSAILWGPSDAVMRRSPGLWARRSHPPTPTVSGRSDSQASSRGGGGRNGAPGGTNSFRGTRSKCTASSPSGSSGLATRYVRHMGECRWKKASSSAFARWKCGPSLTMTFQPRQRSAHLAAQPGPAQKRMIQSTSSSWGAARRRRSKATMNSARMWGRSRLRSISSTSGLTPSLRVEAGLRMLM